MKQLFSIKQAQMQVHGPGAQFSPEEEQSHKQQFPNSVFTNPENKQKLEQIQHGKFNKELESFINKVLFSYPYISKEIANTFSTLNLQELEKQFNLKPRKISWEEFLKAKDPTEVKNIKDWAGGIENSNDSEKVKTLIEKDIQPIIEYAQNDEQYKLFLNRLKDRLFDQIHRKVKNENEAIREKETIEANLSSIWQSIFYTGVEKDSWKNVMFSCMPEIKTYYNKFKLPTQGLKSKYNSAAYLVNQEIIQSYSSGQQSQSLKFLEEMIKNHKDCVIPLIEKTYYSSFSSREKTKLDPVSNNKQKDSNREYSETDNLTYKNTQSLKLFTERVGESVDKFISAVINSTSPDIQNVLRKIIEIPISETDSRPLWKFVTSGIGKNEKSAIQDSIRNGLEQQPSEENLGYKLFDIINNNLMVLEPYSVDLYTPDKEQDANEAMSQADTSITEQIDNLIEYFEDDSSIDALQIAEQLAEIGIQQLKSEFKFQCDQENKNTLPYTARCVTVIGDYALRSMRELVKSMEGNKDQNDLDCIYTLFKNKFNCPASKKVFNQLASGQVPTGMGEETQTNYLLGKTKKLNIDEANGIASRASSIISRDDYLPLSIAEISKKGENGVKFLTKDKILTTDDIKSQLLGLDNYDQIVAKYWNLLGQKFNNALSSSGKTIEEVAGILAGKKQKGKEIKLQANITALNGLSAGKPFRYTNTFFEELATALGLPLESIWSPAPVYDLNNNDDMYTLESKMQNYTDRFIGPITDAKRREKAKKGENDIFSGSNVNFFFQFMKIHSSYLSNKPKFTGPLLESTEGRFPSNRPSPEKEEKYKQDIKNLQDSGTDYPKDKEEIYSPELPKTGKPTKFPMAPTEDTGKDYGTRIIRVKDPETGNIKFEKINLVEDLSHYETALSKQLSLTQNNEERNILSKKLEFLKDPEIHPQEKVNLLIDTTERLPKYLKRWKKEDIEYSDTAKQALTDIRELEEQEKSDLFAKNSYLKTIIKLAKNKLKLNGRN